MLVLERWVFHPKRNPVNTYQTRSATVAWRAAFSSPIDDLSRIHIPFKGYKDGLQPESLADGNWLVKHNQPVSKIETKFDTNLRSLYESWFRSAFWSQNQWYCDDKLRKEEIQSLKEQTHAVLKHSFKKVSVSHAQLAHFSTLAKEKHMLLILNFSTLTFITNARTTMPFARLYSQMVCTQSEPAEIPQHMFVQILVQVGEDRKWKASRTTLRTPLYVWYVTAFLFTARGHEKSASLHTFKCLKRKSQMNSCMGICVALSNFCLNIALPCSPLNIFKTWADQQ